MLINPFRSTQHPSKYIHKTHKLHVALSLETVVKRLIYTSVSFTVSTFLMFHTVNSAEVELDRKLHN